MKVFKVIFNNNAAVSAEFNGYRFKNGCELAKLNGKRIIRSLNVVADNEAESIAIANNIASQYFLFANSPH